MMNKIDITEKKKNRIFISALVFDSGQSGLSVYTRHLVNALSRQDSICLAMLKKDSIKFSNENKSCHIIIISDIFSNPILNILWHYLILPFYVHYYQCDSLILPAINRRMTLWVGKPTLGIVHDLSQFHINKKYDRFRSFYVKYLLPLIVSRLDIIIAISQSTKNDLIKFWKIPASRINVCYNGYDRKIYNCTTPNDPSYILTKYNIKKPYLLYVSRIEHPGKNHINLIKAFERLSNQLKQEYNLVFVGSDWCGSEVVNSYITNCSIKEQVLSLGYVPTEDLPALYHAAKASIFPSLYEGFGMPLLESMACGTPTLSSNCAALTEIGGNAVLTFDPLDPTDIADKITKSLTVGNLLTSLTNNGLKRTQQFSWLNLADSIHRLFFQHALKSSNRSHETNV